MMATEVNEKEILELLKCGRCANFITGKIYECSRGHIVCANCCKQFVKCRICRCWIKTEMRNYTLEAMSTYIPCPFVNSEQTFKPIGLEIRRSLRNNASLEPMKRRLKNSL